MLPFDILISGTCVYTTQADQVVQRNERFEGGGGQNAWEQALLYVQENNAPESLNFTLDQPHFWVLCYCAADLLLTKRFQLMNPDRVDNWYMLLDDWVCPLLQSNQALGKMRLLYGIDWLHAKAIRETPLQNVWLDGHYWPTLVGFHLAEEMGFQNLHLERWSFFEEQWYIQRWAPRILSLAKTKYVGRTAEGVQRREALARTLALSERERLAAWGSIPLPLRTVSLLDLLLHTPNIDHLVMPLLAQWMDTDIADLSFRLDMGRAIQATAETIIKTWHTKDEAWTLPEDSEA